MRMARNGSVQSTAVNGSGVAPHVIDQRTFVKRLKVLYSHWRQHKDELWGSADFLAIAAPPLNLDNIGCLKSSTFNRWLLGYEFPETVTVFGNKQIHFLCSPKKNACLLETVKRSAKEAVDVEVVIHKKLKGKKGTSKIDYVIHSMHMSNSEVRDEPIVGYIARESPEGLLLENWTDKLKNCGLQLSDVTDGLSDLLAIEDPDELTRQKNEETASRLASRDSSADDYGANLNTLTELNAYGGPKLVLAENKLEPIRLSYLYIHPPFAGQESMISGTLEAHANGFRYSTSRGDEQVDIMYANIKHAFFQPQEMVLYVSLVHFHLHNHIMVGDKKTKDVQFSLERIRTLDTFEDEETENFDAKEIMERRKYDFDNYGKTGFQYFVSRVDCLWLQPQFKKHNLKFEWLREEHGFEGRIAPNKTFAFIVPTSSCLVELMFTPFDVIPLSEIEIVNLERVGFSMQTDFDMAVVFKDLKRDVMRIDSIPFGEYDVVVGWLDTTAVQYFETRVNIHWRAIIKTFTDDPQAFIDVGGWDFLNREKEIYIDNGGGFMHLDLAKTDFWPGQYEYRRGQYDYLLKKDKYDYLFKKDKYDYLFKKDNSDDDTQSSTGCSAPKRRRLKKATFIKMRVGRCFSAPKIRRRIKKAGPGSSSPCWSLVQCSKEEENKEGWSGSSAPKRSKLM